MTVEINVLNFENEEVWVKGNICTQWIAAGWRVVGTQEEINLVIGGTIITVKETEQLREYLKDL